MVFLATMALAAFLYVTVPTGFFPQQDTGFIQGVVLTSQDASFLKTRTKVEQVGQLIGEDPDVEEVDAHVRAVMQQGLDDLAAQRRFPVIG